MTVLLSVKMTQKQARDLHQKAHAAGLAAVEQCRPTPMVVQQHANQLDDNSPVVKQWHVPDGPCGFAWVSIKPCRGPFVTFCKKNGIGSRSDYHKAWHITPWDTKAGRTAQSQSIELKSAYCGAYAQVLREAGINAWMESRLD